MFSLERWQEIFESLSKNKLRSVLTGVAVASGIFILVILLGAGNGIQHGIEHQFAQDAVNKISVWPGVTKKEHNGLGVGRQIQLRNKDFELAVNTLGKYIDKKSPVYTVWSGNVVYKKETGSYRIEGVMPDYQFITNSGIVKGRYINNYDNKNFEKVAVIGKKVATDLFKDGQEPLGEYINISGVIYKVVGVFSDPGGERQESAVYIPFYTSQKAYSAGDRIRTMTFTLRANEDFDASVAESELFTKELTKIIQARHSIAPDDESALFINNSLVEAKRTYIVINGVKMFFWFVGICTIFAGIVGVGNIMLIVVKERTKEIGIRKALGASPINIITMVMQEAVFITIISGFMGLLSGLVLWEVIGPYTESDFFKRPEVDFGVAVSTIFLLVVAGCIAGFIPAYRAAKIRPIVALRDE